MSTGNLISMKIGMIINENGAYVSLQNHENFSRNDTPFSSGTSIARAISQEILDVAYRVDLINNQNKEAMNDNG